MVFCGIPGGARVGLAQWAGSRPARLPLGHPPRGWAWGFGKASAGMGMRVCPPRALASGNWARHERAWPCG
eukprot:scaffold723_cov363-Prasinococcus_capsulatus_cf.AAC.17